VGRLDDRVAIVTGGGRGIGRATALRLAEDGATVVVNDVDAEPAHETVELIQKAGGTASASLHNTVNRSEADELVQSTVDQHGKLDIVINNAGTTRDKMFHNMDDDLFDFVFNVNFKTAFHVTLAAVQHMRAKAKAEKEATGRPAYHRKIVNTSSVAAIMGNNGQYNYTAAKGAIIATTRTLALELGPFGINVNAVAPGFVETRLTQNKDEGDGTYGIPEASRQLMKALIAIGRYGQPEDIAAVHAFLAGPDSDFVSGITIPVAGGQLGTM
jgi:3-oxoacyl-[acyl-carrier protein] reductase